MQVFFLRHGTASHLLEDYRRRVNYREFCDLLYSWIKAPLTLEGISEIKTLAMKFTGQKYHLLFSPLIRTKQTAMSFIEQAEPISQHELTALSELFILPPAFSKKVKLSIGAWISLCVFKAIYTLKVVRYIKEARHIMKLIIKYQDDVLIISHQARILTIIISCLLSSKWKILKIDVRPAGLTIIKRVLPYRRNKR